MSIVRLVLAFTLLLLAAFGLWAKPAKSARSANQLSVNVRDFGAVGDGQALDSPAINQAVEACAKSGGGRVLVPPGRYLAGTIQLRNQVTLELAATAILIGSTNLNEYRSFAPPADTPEGRFRSTWHRALILGDGLENIGVIGPGLIDGNKVFDPQGEEKMRGPHTILLGNCRQVTLRDFSVKDSANYAVLLENCQQVEARNLKITGGWDGVHFRGWPDRPCREVSIVGCQFYTGDDSIAGRYWENVLIKDCLINSACNGLRLIGPATHLIIHNCLFYGPGAHPHRTSHRYNMLAGINLQPGAWDATRGNLDDVLISDITMHNVATPFLFTLKSGNTAGRITVNRVAATGAYRAAASVESWGPSPFTHVVFRDVSLEFVGGSTNSSAPPSIRAPGVDARPLPTWGFFARNLKNLTFDNVRLACLQDDFRSVLLAEQVQCLGLDGFKFPRLAGAADPLVLRQVSQVRLRDTDLAVVEPRRLALKPTPAAATARFTVGQPFSVKVTVQNGTQPGLASIDLELAGQILTRWTWLAPNQSKEVLFDGLTASAAGPCQVKSGNLTATFRVEAR